MSRILLLSVALLFSSAMAFSQCPTLIWADEFDGNTLDLSKWSHDVNRDCGNPPCGWYNNELQQYYPENATVANNELTITAARTPPDSNWRYSSARILTQDKFSFTYGRAEARMKLPSGGGLWPAFWGLSNDNPYGPWPLSGEIDIMEWVGNKPEDLLATIHFGSTPGTSIFTGNEIKSLNGTWADEYHVFAIEWEPNVIRWYVDDYLYSTKTIDNVAPERWPFDHDYFLILNLAVGGNLGGAVDNNIFPVDMLVDYVRVYDGNRPSLEGLQLVNSQAYLQSYTLKNVDPNAAVTWTLPANARIVSGAGTPTVQVEWAAPGGILSASTSTPCGPVDIQLQVKVDEAMGFNYSLENFDDASVFNMAFANGNLTEVNNPAPSSPNTSTLVGRYQRDINSQYDVIVYTGNGITDAAPFLTGESKAFIDVYSSAPVGTLVMFQFEAPNAGNLPYPQGRHSRYTAKTSAQNQWQRLPLELLDRPDTNVPSTNIGQLIILFAPNTNSGGVYFYDNLDVYAVGISGIEESLAAYGSMQLESNPVNSSLSLKLDLLEPVTLNYSIVDVQGRFVRAETSESLPSGKQTLITDVSNLSPGTYTIFISVGQARKAISFVKG